MPLSFRAFAFLLAASTLCHQNASAAVCTGNVTTSCGGISNPCTTSDLCAVGDVLVACATKAGGAENASQVVIEVAACLKESGVDFPDEYIPVLAMCAADASGDTIAVAVCISAVESGGLPDLDEWIKCVTEANGDEIEVQVATCFVEVDGESGGDIPDIPDWVQCVLNAGDDIAVATCIDEDIDEGGMEECVIEAGENLMKLFDCFGLGNSDCSGVCMSAAPCFGANGCAALDSTTMMWNLEYDLCNSSGAMTCVSCFPSCEVVGDEGPVAVTERDPTTSPTMAPTTAPTTPTKSPTISPIEDSGCDRTEVVLGWMVLALATTMFH